MVRARAAALGQLGKGDAPVVEGLLALLKDVDPSVRVSAAVTIGKLGQKQTDWTDDRLLELLQDNLSGYRKTAAMVLATRQILRPATYEKIMALRNDSRFWVRIAAWDALLQIEKVREARKRDAERPQPIESAK